MSRFSGPIRSVSNPNVNSGNSADGSPNNGFVCQSGSLGSIASPPTDALIIIAAANAAAANTMTVTNAALGQASVLTIPDPGAATANFVLDSGTNASATFTAATITTLTGTTANVTTVNTTSTNATNIDAGASGTAGSLDVYPTTAASGKIALVAADNAGDTTTTITNASQAGARTYTLPDAGASASFAMLATAQTAVIGSTQAELDNQCDVSLNTEVIAESGVVSVTKRITSILSTGAGAVTLDAPSAATLGMVKVIQMTGGEHDITLALTNVQGQSSGTTATFSDTNDTLVLVAGTNKWTVIGEAGIALS